MPRYRYQVTLQRLSGLSKDRVVNVFHADATSLANGISFMTGPLEAFYDSAGTGQTNALGEYLGTSISRVADVHTIKMYDLADPEPRTPVADSTFTMPAELAGGVDFPNEVAACLSFQGDPVSGSPQSRRRGRIYFGPVRSTTAGEGGGGEMFLIDPFLTDLAAAGLNLRDNAFATWSVYSRVDDLMVEITNGWVDNAFDTQRRRGEDATLRTLWS